MCFCFLSVLPGGSDKESDATPNMVKFLFGKMDVNKDGKVRERGREGGHAEAQHKSDAGNQAQRARCDSHIAGTCLVSPPQVSKEEFCMTWNSVIGAMLVSREGGPLDCCIM